MATLAPQESRVSAVRASRWMTLLVDQRAQISPGLQPWASNRISSHLLQLYQPLVGNMPLPALFSVEYRMKRSKWPFTRLVVWDFISCLSFFLNDDPGLAHPSLGTVALVGSLQHSSATCFWPPLLSVACQCKGRDGEVKGPSVQSAVASPLLLSLHLFSI